MEQHKRTYRSLAISKSGPLKLHTQRTKAEPPRRELQRNFCSEFAELLINLKQLKVKYFKNVRINKQSKGAKVKYLRILLSSHGISSRRTKGSEWSSGFKADKQCRL